MSCHLSHCNICRWDLFPGISASDFPACNEAENDNPVGRESLPGTAALDIAKCRKSVDKARSHSGKDLLAATFDIPDIEAAE